MFTKLCIFLCTCRCEPVTGHTSLCDFIHSFTHYHIVVTNESEVIMQAAFELAQRKNSKCNQFLAYSLCLYLFRNCELRNTSDPSSGWQLGICKNRCSDLMKVGVECFNGSHFQTAVENLSDNEDIIEFAAWAMNFSCYDPTTYAIPGVPISNTSCDNISFVDGLLPSTSTGEPDIHAFIT